MKKFTFIAIALMATIFLNTVFAQNITQRGSTTTAPTTTATLTIAKPTGLAVGDVMLVNIVQGDDDNLLLSNASRTGWTVVRGAEFGDNGNNSWWGTVLYRVADAADAIPGNFAFTMDADADISVGGLMVFFNVNAAGGVGPTGAGTGPFDVAAGTLSATGNSSSATITAPGITPVTNNAAIIMFAMSGDNNNIDPWTTTSPGTLTEILDAGSGTNPDVGVGAAWALQPYAAATGNGTATMDASDRNGGCLIALRPATTYGAPNLWSVSGTGALRKYTMNPVTGALLGGPVTVATPLVSTAAVAKNKVTGSDVDGCIYYLNRDESNTLNGVVTVYSVKPDGTNNASRGTIDMNGGSNEDFSFVRLGFDDLGRGWILAGSDASGNIYIASFTGNGVNNISGVNTFGNISLTVAAPGTSAEFQNGDLAITANGTMYALANVTNGQTYVYTLNSLNTPTTLTRRWTVQDNGGTFSGSVNGLAWTQSGSLHFSTSTDIYFIDQFTANQGAGTVQATVVPNTSGLSLTDLGSDKFPLQTTLPVILSDFTVTKQGSNAMLNWITASENNSSHFVIERSMDGVHFTVVGTKQAAGNSSDIIHYQFADPIASLTGVLYYRIKMVDIDGAAKYSKIAPLRLNGMIVKNFTVYPNPFSDNLKIELNSEKEAAVTVRLHNSAGQVVINRSTLIQKGDNVIVLSSELSALQAGMYVVEIISEDGKQAQKIIKR